ncbi:MAG: hypothetical protein JNJ71_02080 [Rubrivivax sp.]|nr:hypothetical protein [Rubrivivax sp.]
MNLSRFFSLAEMTASDTARQKGIPNEPDAQQLQHLRNLANAVLDPLREAVGAPIKVSSGFRSPQLNAAIPGSSSTSQHSLGQAADLQPSTVSVLELFKTVIRLGLPFDQVIFEARSAQSKWVHVSHKAGANRGEIRVAQFDANGKPTSYPLISRDAALAMSDPTAPRSRGARSALPALTYVESGDEPHHEPPAEQAPAKKTAAKKAAPRKTAAKAPAAKAPPAKKAAAKKTAASPKSPTAKKAAVKKAAPPKAGAAAKAPAKQSAPAKAAAKAPAKATPKATAAKAVPRKSPGRKSAG